VSRTKVKNTKHSYVRARQRTDLNKKQIKNLMKEAQRSGKCPYNFPEGPIRNYLLSKGNHKRIKVYKDYVFVFSKTSTSCITLYPLKPELKQKQKAFEEKKKDEKKNEQKSE